MEKVGENTRRTAVRRDQLIRDGAAIVGADLGCLRRDTEAMYVTELQRCYAAGQAIAVNLQLPVVPK
jgi:hypothetical protein